MQTQEPVIANYKIFAFVGFVCAALITSLFVYRTTHNAPAPIQSENVLVMPAGRDLKSVDLMTTNGDSFSEKNLYKHWTLMFFGFTHCNSVCPATLTMLAQVYPALHQAFPNLQVVLVSLDPVHDDKATLQQYTENYHHDFIGVSGKIESIRKLQSQLGVYSAEDKNSGQLQHTPSIMLISPQAKWVAMLRYGMPPALFAKTLEDTIHSLT